MGDGVIDAVGALAPKAKGWRRSEEAKVPSPSGSLGRWCLPKNNAEIRGLMGKRKGRGKRRLWQKWQVSGPT